MQVILISCYIVGNKNLLALWGKLKLFSTAMLQSLIQNNSGSNGSYPAQPIANRTSSHRAKRQLVSRQLISHA